MDDHNTGEVVKAAPKLMHNCEEPSLARQTDQTLPKRKHQETILVCPTIEHSYV